MAHNENQQRDIGKHERDILVLFRQLVPILFVRCIKLPKVLNTGLNLFQILFHLGESLTNKIIVPSDHGQIFMD